MKTDVTIGSTLPPMLAQQFSTELSLRCLTPEDRKAHREMSIVIYNALPCKELLIPMTEEEYDDTYREGGEDVVYGIFDGDLLIATSSLLHDVRAYAPNPELDEILKHKCAEIGESMVLPKYRGHGLMLYLNSLIKAEAERQGVEFMLATAHPDNIASNTSLLQLGYHIVKEFTRAGKRRNLHVMNIKNEPKGVKNLLFDLAGVLLNLDIEQDTKALTSVGLPDFEECIRRPEIFRPVLAYLNGLTDEKEFLPQIRPYCKADATDDQILWSMDAVLADIPVSRLAMLKELKKRYKVYLLSNLNERDWIYTQKLIREAGYDLGELFDDTFISYQMKLAKPDHRIFHEVIRTTGITPEETLYLDDTGENVEAGKTMGFQVWKVPMNRIETLLPMLGL